MATLLVPSGVFLAARVDLEAEPERVGSLSSYVADMAARPPPAGALPSGTLREAREIALNRHSFRFCQEELLPLLRSQAVRAGARAGRGPRIPGAACESLEKRSAELLARLNRPLEREPPEVLADWLGVPCLVTGRRVMPMEPVERADRQGIHVRVAGTLYRLRTEEEPRPVAEQTRRARRQSQNALRRQLSADRDLMMLASELVADAHAIVERYRPDDRGHYRIVHSGAEHQLQYSHGHWVLARGPLASRANGNSLFVGLQIRGANRKERLCVRPRPAPNPDSLWTPRGEPMESGLCMGGAVQYRRLLSRSFTDAEAVLQWLDAGVIVATGRSDYHRLWRFQREDLGESAVDLDDNFPF